MYFGFVYGINAGARKMRFAMIRGGVQAKGLRAASNGLCAFGLIRG